MLDCPRLWTSLVFRLHRKFDAALWDPRHPNSSEFIYNERELERAGVILKRSRTYPLRVVVEPLLDRDLPRRKFLEDRRLRKFLDMIREHISRIEDFDFTVADAASAEQLVLEVVAWPEVPLMTRLALRCTDPHQVATLDSFTAEQVVDRPFPVIPELSKTSSLRHLTLSMINFFDIQVLDSLVTLQSLTLTHYTPGMEGKVDPVNLLLRLQNLPQLKHVELNGLLHNDPSWITLPPLLQLPNNPPKSITLQALTSLEVQGLTGQFKKVLFKHLDAPNLHTLTMRHAPYTLGAVQAFEQIATPGKFPLLNTFHISDCCYSVWQEILFHLDWVVTMSVARIAKCICRKPHRSAFDYCTYLPSFESQWVQSSDMGKKRWFCAKLQDLTIEVHGEQHCGELRKMLRGRVEEAQLYGRHKEHSEVERLVVMDCTCHEPLPDNYRAAFQRYCPNFSGPPQKYKKQRCVR